MDRSKRFPGGSLKAFLEHVEDEAQALRARAGVGPTGRLDLRALTAELKIHLVRLDEIVALSPEDRALLCSAMDTLLDREQLDFRSTEPDRRAISR